VKHSIFVLSAGLVFSGFLFFISSCSKINEATELGSDLIPAVDNITTFDTTLEVEAYNDLFTILNDSTRSSINSRHFLGEITNDPLFGKTTATIFTDFKPQSFPFRFPAAKDSLYIDSVVVVLSYKGTYGDTTAPHNINIFNIDPSVSFRYDSSYLLRQRPFATQGQLLGTRNGVIPATLDDSLFLFNESANNQLRIKLDNNFGEQLLKTDTVKYNTDSAFKAVFKGLEFNAAGGNSLMSFQLTDSNSKLAIYYRYTKNGQDDTTVTYFRPSQASASANYIERDYSASQLNTYLGGTTPDDLVFLQNTPGSFATIKIPALGGLNNRIIHRAELIVEQVYDPSDAIFTPPQFLYLDAFDSEKNYFKTIPFDVTFDPNSGQLNYQLFGMMGDAEFDGSGNPINIWRFNLSRYVQNVVTDVEKSHDLRLYAPYLTYNRYNFNGAPTEILLPVNSQYAAGRVRVGGGNHPTQKMRLRIIYSKI
jgi:hypothetical protein